MEHLFDLPHAQAEALVRTGAPVYLHVNPVEYHGPHLSLHNDRLCAVGLSRRLHARLAPRHPEWPLLLGEDLEIGVGPCKGPGTRATRFAVTRELVLSACQALVELGAQRVVLMTFHGAPLHNLAIEAGVEALEAQGVRAVAPFNIVLRRMLMLNDPGEFAPGVAHITDETERAQMLRDLQFDFHAGFFETSIAMHLCPDSVAKDLHALPPCPAVTPDARFVAAARVARVLRRDVLSRELLFAAHGTGWEALDPFLGYTGRPHLASADAGRFFVDKILDAYLPVVENVLAGRARSPQPIMTWTENMTLGGRLAT